MTLWKLLQTNKAQMHPLFFAAQHYVVPLYIAASSACLVLFGLHCGGGRTAEGIWWLAAWGILTALLLAFVPLMRRRVLKDELARYDFDVEKVPPREQWTVGEGEDAVSFDRFGMTAHGVLRYYNHLSPTLTAVNTFYRVHLFIRFINDADGFVLRLPVEAWTLRMLKDCGIRLTNQDKLDVLLADKEKAFRTILNKGRL